MSSRQELEVAIASIAEGQGFEQTNANIEKTVFNANKLSEKQYNVVVRGMEQGKNINEISQDLRGLEREERNVAQAAREAEQAQGGFTQGLSTLQGALGALGIALTTQQLIQFGQAAREAARVETDSINTLRAAAGTTVDYQKALQLGREATRGMASDQQIASSEATLLGAGLATTAEDAAELTSAGAILSGVFANVGGSMEKFNMLLSSGSPMLLNNFGLTKEMVAARQQELEATKGMNAEEAKTQALKDVLIAQSKKYKDSLSEETIAAQQNQASQANFMAAAGTFINELDKATGVTTDLTKALDILTEGLRNNKGELGGWTAALRDGGDFQSQLADRLIEAGVVLDEEAEKAEAANQVIENLSSSVDAAASTYGSTAGAAQELIAAQQELTNATDLSASAFGGQTTAIAAAGGLLQGPPLLCVKLRLRAPATPR